MRNRLLASSSIVVVFMVSLLGAAPAAPGAPAETPAASPAAAAAQEGYKPQRVSADAQWVVYVDVSGLFKSALVKFFMENGGEVGLQIEQADLEEMKQQLGGLDPMRDIHTLTIYGQGRPEEGGHLVMLAETSAAIDGLVKQLSGGDDAAGEKPADAPDITAVELDGQRVNVLSDGEKTAYFQVRPGATSADRLVILSLDREWMARGLGALDGRAPTLERSDKTALKARPPAGALLFVNAGALDWINLGGGEDDEPTSAILRSAKGLTAAFGESDDQTFVEMKLDTGKAEDAQNLGDIARGLMAMGRMAAGHDEGLKAATKPMSAIKLTTEGSTIGLSFRYSTQGLIEIARQVSAAGEDDDDANHSKHEVKAEISIGSKSKPKAGARDDHDDDED